MNNLVKSKILNSERGVSLIITFFIMIIILSVVLSVSTLLYGELRVMRNVGNSVVGFYEADSGVEKVLYYNRQVRPLVSSDIGCSSNEECIADLGADYFCDDSLCKKHTSMGLCSMFDPNNGQFCNSSGSSPDSSVYCTIDTTLSQTGYKTGSVDPIHGCDYNTCDDCTISFRTMLDGDPKKTYYTAARIYPDSDGVSSNLDISSKGSFGGSARQIQTLSTTRDTSLCGEIGYPEYIDGNLLCWYAGTDEQSCTDVCTGVNKVPVDKCCETDVDCKAGNYFAKLYSSVSCNSSCDQTSGLAAFYALNDNNTASCSSGYGSSENMGGNCDCSSPWGVKRVCACK